VIYDEPSVVYTESLPMVGASVVAEVQAELRRQNFYHGAVDGVLGPRTRNAIADFQDEHDLAVTGRINNSLLRELGLD
jgi:peptidoglycan hydrolase-like protein with peptidoglycan-binding domain